MSWFLPVLSRLGQVAAPEVCPSNRYHLAARVLPPPQHDLLQGRDRLLVQEVNRCSKLWLYFSISSHLTWQNQTITNSFCFRPDNFEDWSVAAWRDLSSPGWNSTNSTLRSNNQNIQMSLLQVAAFPLTNYTWKMCRCQCCCCFNRTFTSMFLQWANNQKDRFRVIFDKLTYNVSIYIQIWSSVQSAGSWLWPGKRSR